MGACRDLCQDIVELSIKVRLLPEEVALEPFHGRGAGEHARLQNIGARLRGSVADHVPVQVLRHLSAGREQEAARPQRQGYLALFYHALAQHAALLVAACADHRHALLKACLLSKFLRRVSKDAARSLQLAELFLIHLKELQKSRIPLAGLQVHQEGTASISIIRVEIPGHMVHQVIRNHRQLIGLLIEIRLVLAHPLHLRAGKYRIDPGAAELEDLPVMLLHGLAQRHRPLVLPHLGVPQMISFPIHRNHGRALGGQSHHVDALLLLSGKFRGFLHNLRHAVLEIQRILLNPAMLQRDHLVFLLHGMEHGPILAEQDAAHT